MSEDFETFYESINGDIDEIPQSIWEEIFEGLYSYISSGEKSCSPHHNVDIWEFHRNDTLNVSACGTYSIAGTPAFDFELRDGNNNGSEIVNISEPDSMSPPKRYYKRYYFAPDEAKIGGQTPEEHKKLMKRAWQILKNNPSMQENQKKMAYDLTMCPATKTRQYWKEYASKISAVILSEAVEVSQ